jgi:hypothetical protein
MNFSKRLDVIAEGLPIILDSASGFLNASKRLHDLPREADVLIAFAAEEAAKALILIDIVRCPARLVPSKIGIMTKWFYNHLARLIYAEACLWKPMHVVQLQQYVKSELKSHYLEGDYGEYIVPNWQLYSRESTLYADIEADEEGNLSWSEPRGFPDRSLVIDPRVCVVLQALEAIGAFTREGLEIVSSVWGQLEFRDEQTSHDSEALIQKTLERLDERKLPLQYASESHVRALRHDWQLPMYNLDFGLIEVSMSDLERERDASLPW